MGGGGFGVLKESVTFKAPRDHPTGDTKGDLSAKTDAVNILVVKEFALISVLYFMNMSLKKIQNDPAED